MRKFRLFPSPPLAAPAIFILLISAAGGCGDGSESGGPVDKAAAEWALGLGGTVVVAGDDDEIAQVDDLPDTTYRLLRIDLNQVTPPVTDQQLENLPPAPGLEYLGLHSAQITDGGIAPLLELTGLQELELSYTQIGDASLEQLARLEQLDRLYLYGTQVTDEGVERFRQKRPDCAVYRD